MKDALNLPLPRIKIHWLRRGLLVLLSVCLFAPLFVIESMLECVVKYCRWFVDVWDGRHLDQD